MGQSSSLLTVIAGIWALGALPTLAAGLAGWDPVGRLETSGRGGRLRAPWARFLFELPALVTFPAIYLASGNLHWVGNVALVLWLAHYGHRGLVWCWLVPKPGLAFALWTIANLVPRALWRRAWYRENFDGYPPGRAALLPGVL